MAELSEAAWWEGASMLIVVVTKPNEFVMDWPWRGTKRIRRSKLGRG
ncbi:MAG: hypothetical protein ACRD9R_04450 [Pyrinomonadaceae bacterium]